MATSGMRMKDCCVSIRALNDQRHEITDTNTNCRQRAWIVLAVFVGVLFLAACTVPTHYGAPLPDDTASRLQPGKSTPADILMVFGEPRGKGVARFSPKEPLVTVWVYEKVDTEAMTMGRTQRHLALVFLKEESYSGETVFSYSHLMNIHPRLLTGNGFSGALGTWPDTGKLESALIPGRSTRADIVALLGEPAGKGSALLPIADKPKTLWLYQREEINKIESRHAMLIIFLDKDIFDGYLWFSTFPRKE